MEERLNKTFQLWPANVETLINNEEDKRFLESMKTDRSATFGSHDRVLANNRSRRVRENVAEERKKKA